MSIMMICVLETEADSPRRACPRVSHAFQSPDQRIECAHQGVSGQILETDPLIAGEGRVVAVSNGAFILDALCLMDRERQ